MAKKRIVIVADTQAPFHLPQAVALACAFNKAYDPDILIMNGDMIDFFTISKFTKVGRHIPNRVVDEIAICEEEVIKPLVASVRKGTRIIWNEGNHEFRLLRYVAAVAPQLEGLKGLSLEDALHCKELGIEYNSSRAGNGIIRLTPLLTIMHGNRGGMNPAKQQYDKWGGSLVMGHAHKEATYRMKHGEGRDNVALASGCLCQDPDWEDIDNYTRGFIAGWIDDETGEFGLDHMRMGGDKYTNLYTPWGEFYATWVQKAGKPGSWTGREAAAKRGVSGTRRANLRPR